MKLSIPGFAGQFNWVIVGPFTAPYQPDKKLTQGNLVGSLNGTFGSNPNFSGVVACIEAQSMMGQDPIMKDHKGSPNWC